MYENVQLIWKVIKLNCPFSNYRCLSGLFRVDQLGSQKGYLLGILTSLQLLRTDIICVLRIKQSSQSKTLMFKLIHHRTPVPVCSL